MPAKPIPRFTRPILRCVPLAAMLLFAGAPVFPQEAQTNVKLWTDPGHIAERDLFWGSGSVERTPTSPHALILLAT